MSQEQPQSEPNPYAAPQSVPWIDTTPGRSSAPPYALYSVGGIVLGTFFGSVLAMAVLIAIDYGRLGRGRAAKMAVATGFAAQIALLICVMFVLPERIPNMAVNLPQLLLAYLVAEGLLDRKLTAHYQAGGRAASLWKAIGIGMLCFAANMICVFGLALLQSDQLEADVFIE
ncbi:MAG TPA: hypothetical protein VJ783_16680 [Pirellulales bacterium]|nr:hypothetical protein [Pirellulales bacterium]